MSVTDVWRARDLFSCLQLLKTIHALFGKALHSAGSSVNKAFFRSTLTRLSYVLHAVDPSDRTQKIPTALPARVARALESFEGLVDESVRRHTPGGSQDGPKLALLEDLADSDLPSVFKFKELEDVDRSSDVRDAVDQCIVMLERLSAPRSTDRPLEASTDENKLRNDRVKSWRHLYQQLSRHPVSCRSSEEAGIHEARIDLGKLSASVPTLHLLCSTCNREGLAGWHPVDFHLAHDAIEAEPQQQQRSVEWCRHLQGSHLQKSHRTKSLQFFYNEQQVWIPQSGAKARRCQINPPLQSLQQVLENSRSIHHVGRKRLQCLLAQALWLLCDTPWLPDDWSLDALWLSEAAGNVNYNTYRTPFAQCPVWIQSTERATSFELPDARFMMRFSLLLLRIECPEYLSFLHIDNEDSLDDLELDEELQRLREDEEIGQRIVETDTLRDILQVCQDWDDGNRMEPSFILEKIFHPLRVELRDRFFEEFTENTTDQFSSMFARPYLFQRG